MLNSLNLYIYYIFFLYYYYELIIRAVHEILHYSLILKFKHIIFHYKLKKHKKISHLLNKKKKKNLPSYRYICFKINSIKKLARILGL
jgi:hypothetical protein